MLYDLKAVRDNVRNRDGNRVFYLGSGDQLMSEARDWLQKERIAILPASQAKPEGYHILSGGYTTEKPEHMTHLHGNVLVPKTHPRIAFRGAVDRLEGELLMAVSLSQGELREKLGQVLQLTRNLIRWDVMEEPVPEGKLWGLTEREIHDRSHFPQKYYNQPHFMPTGEESRLLLQLNLARCAARNAELQAVRAFTDREGIPTRPELLRELNRLSSAIYVLMIECKIQEQEGTHGTGSHRKGGL